MEAGSNSSSLSSDDQYYVRLLLAMVTSAACCLCCIINITILFVLRSKPVFSQCPRYVLLFNLVLADTFLLVQAQLLYLLSVYKIRMSYPLCISLALPSYMTSQIAPYMLIFMSLERCIAVCFPFRHTLIVTLRNTYLVNLLIWTVSCVDIFIRALLILEFPFHMYPDLMMKQFCSILIVQFGQTSKLYDAVYTNFLFSLAAVIILSSFVAVMIVACLASADRAQAEKTRNTLLLHLFQLGLSLLSVMNSHLFVAVIMCCGTSNRLFVLVYVTVVLMPRCLSALAYGIRDPTLRPALGKYLCCSVRLFVGTVQVKGSVHWKIATSAS